MPTEENSYQYNMGVSHDDLLVHLGGYSPEHPSSRAVQHKLETSTVDAVDVNYARIYSCLGGEAMACCVGN